MEQHSKAKLDWKIKYLKILITYFTFVLNYYIHVYGAYYTTRIPTVEMPAEPVKGAMLENCKQNEQNITAIQATDNKYNFI